MKSGVDQWTYNKGFLEHHGIKDMKWHVRRFQNPDGTLTPEGKIRYSDAKKERREQKRAEREEKKAAKKASIPESSTWKANEAKYLSDAELNRRNNRLQKEQQYKQMTKSKSKKAKEAMKKTANAIFIASAINVMKGLANQQYRTAITKGIAATSKKIADSGIFSKAANVLTSSILKKGA